MDILKSQLPYYQGLLSELLLDDPQKLSSRKHLERDVQTIMERTAQEGLSFLTKTLPKLGKALLEALENTRFNRPREFKRSHGSASRPAFLQAYFNQVIDEEGYVRDSADPGCVKHILQVCFLCYKLELPYTLQQQEVVINNFLSTEEELMLSDSTEVTALVAAASYICRTVFEGYDPQNILPRHGPGSVATGEKLEQKWLFRRFYRAIHQVYPYYQYFMVGGVQEMVDRLGWYASLEVAETGTAKVVLVPKDSRGPRLISAEPLEYMWVQQGLGRSIMAHLESNFLTRGQVNFEKQSVNRSLAQQSSITRENATIDLKDASDRVSVQLVSEVFRHTPELLRALLATRTTATALPDGRVVPLKKFAPMGSALCFPIEAFVFWAVSVAAICRATGKPPLLVGRSVFVFGDDIICRVEDVDTVMEALELVGLRVNRQKCYIRGYFRESCGMDAFKGVQVTPVRIKTPWTEKRSDPKVYVSYLAFFNNLRNAGYERASLHVLNRLRAVYGAIPHGFPDSAFPCVHEPSLGSVLSGNRKAGVKVRVDQAYQRLAVKTRFAGPLRRPCTLDGWLRLTRDLVMGAGDDPSVTVVPRRSVMRYGWKLV